MSVFKFDTNTLDKESFSPTFLYGGGEQVSEEQNHKANNHSKPGICAKNIVRQKGAAAHQEEVGEKG